MILFCIALPQEAKAVKEALKKIPLQKEKIEFLITGVGIAQTIYALKDYIDKKGKPDFIVNIGVCGHIGKQKSLIQAYRIEYLSNHREVLCPLYLEQASLQSIACSDKIITDPLELGNQAFVDMESYGIDFVCAKENIAYIILKQPFDIISDHSKNISLTSLYQALLEVDYTSLLEKIYLFIANKKTKISFDLTGWKQKHKLTHSESLFLEKYFNKKISFGWNLKEIEQYLEPLEKKDFLKEIKD